MEYCENKRRFEQVPNNVHLRSMQIQLQLSKEGRQVRNFGKGDEDGVRCKERTASKSEGDGGNRAPHSRRLSCSPSAYHSVRGQDLYVEFIVAESALLRFMDVFRRNAAACVIYRGALYAHPFSSVHQPVSFWPHSLDSYSSASLREGVTRKRKQPSSTRKKNPRGRLQD